MVNAAIQVTVSHDLGRQAAVARLKRIVEAHGTFAPVTDNLDGQSTTLLDGAVSLVDKATMKELAIQVSHYIVTDTKATAILSFRIYDPDSPYLRELLQMIPERTETVLKKILA